MAKVSFETIQPDRVLVINDDDYKSVQPFDMTLNDGEGAISLYWAVTELRRAYELLDSERKKSSELIEFVHRTAKTEGWQDAYDLLEKYKESTDGS